MITSKNVMLFLLFFSSVLCAEDSVSPQAPNTPNIKPDCSIMVDPNRNPLEQLLDYIYGRGVSYGLWVETPNRAVPVVGVSSNGNNEVTYLRFAIPHRIDMDSRYSDEINEAVDTRKELPFAAYKYVRDVDAKDTFNIHARDEVITNVRPIDAGKYGYMMCWNLSTKNNRDCQCTTMKEFAAWLKWVKPNETEEEKKAARELFKAELEAKKKAQQEQAAQSIGSQSN